MTPEFRSSRPGDEDPSGTVDDWLGKPGASVVPSRAAPPPPTEDEIRADLMNAPEAEETKTDDTDNQKAARRDGGSVHSGTDRAPRGPSGDGRQGGAGDSPPRRPTGRQRGEIFPRCPVTPLGIHGDLSFYLDTRGQLRAVDNHTLQKMLHIFGGMAGLLAQHFPTFSKDSPDPQPGKFNQLQLSTAMISATTERGVWSPVGKVRGAGCWTDEDGRLIFHAGDQVLIDGEWRDPGVYGGRVYPAGDPVPRPHTDAADPDAVAEILDLIASWCWRRPDVDPMLMLGAICAQMLGGALDWRPVTWLTGDQATGKSTFQKLLRYLHGGTQGLLQASDATEAGIRSVIGYASLPVAIDELEPDEDPSKGKAGAIIRLARIAASGDQILRGSTDQKGYQSNAYSCFLFSSILVPPLPTQDRSRLILLDLNRVPDGSRQPNLEPRRLRQLGARLRRRLIDNWPTFQQRLELWQHALADAGHSGRIAKDNYSTVLALADMALSDELPADDMLANWAKKLDRHLAADKEEAGSNADDMLVHLMSQSLDPWRKGRRYSVASWVALAANLEGSPESLDGTDWAEANKILADYGMRVQGRKIDAKLYLATGKRIAGLRGLFEKTQWADGGWAQAARRIQDAEPAASSLTFNRVPSRAYVIPFTSIPGLLNAMERPPEVAPAGAPLPAGMEDYI